MDLILGASRSTEDTVRLAALFVVVVGVTWLALWGLAKLTLPAFAKVVRSITAGKKISTPLGTLEDAGPTSAEPVVTEALPLDQVDEVALAHPRDVNAVVVSRQLDEVFDALRGVTQILAACIQEADNERHLAKRDHVRIVWDGQVEGIVRRLIHNGLDAIAERDEDAYARDRADRLYHAFKDELDERLVSRGVAREDLQKAVRTQAAAVLDRLRDMWRGCIRIAKSANKDSLAV